MSCYCIKTVDIFQLGNLEFHDQLTDRTESKDAIASKNLVVFKVYCNTFVVTFQCSETSLTSSESKQDETKLDKANIQYR